MSDEKIHHREIAPASEDSRHISGDASRAPEPEVAGTIGRRELLKVVTSVPVAALVSISSVPPAAARTTPAPVAVREASVAALAETGYQRKVLGEHEWKTIRLLSDMIIPADERSGSATAAGVPEFIDDWLDFKGDELRAQIRGGLTWLDLECNRQFNHDFAECSLEQQKKILDRIAYPRRAAPEDAAGVAFFNRLRDLVLCGFFSSKMGVKDLPYLGNQMLSSWDGCPPKVLARLGLK